jgi:hypothetical protein
VTALRSSTSVGPGRIRKSGRRFEPVTALSCGCIAFKFARELCEDSLAIAFDCNLRPSTPSEAICYAMQEVPYSSH